MNALAAAAAQALQMNRTTTLRIVALGPREDDEDLWRRRLFAAKDELVRLGVPSARIRYEGNGPYLIVIRANQPARSQSDRLNGDTDEIADPMSEG